MKAEAVRRGAGPLLAWLLVAIGTRASACPFCAGGPEGVNDVRTAIFGSGFGTNLLAVTLPFAVLLGLAWFIHGPAREPLAERGAFDGNAD